MSKIKNFFKPEDFTFIKDGYNNYASETANKKLNALIQSWPVVYLNDHRNINSGIRFISTEQTKLNTHKARLASIEEIVKGCKHEPGVDYINNRFVWKDICKHCGVELQATWSEKK